MRHRSRRRLDVFLVGLAAVTAGAGASIGALVGDTERVGSYWTSATIDESGVAQVAEVIDYDFGPRVRRGIFRDVPGLTTIDPVTVRSETAPDDVLLSDTGFGDEVETRIRIGDPNVTISGRHRYTITYPLRTLVQGDQVSWNGVGPVWEVGMDEVEIHLLDVHELTDVQCDRGSFAAVGGCEATVVEPGHLLVEATGLDAREGITITALRGDRLAARPFAPLPPSGGVEDPGSGWLLPGLASMGAAAVVAVPVSRTIRRKGREQVFEGGAADAAFGPPTGTDVAIRTVDADELAEMSTIEFEAPRNLSAAAGGIIHAESVKSSHQLAWLIEAAIREEIELVQIGEDDKDLGIVRGPATPHPIVAPVLDAMFDGRDLIELGEYDEVFAQGWSQLGEQLREWMAASGMWDPAGDRARSRSIGWGWVAGIVGLAVAVLGGLLANRYSPMWLVVAALGGLLAGGGFTAATRAWELRVRTAQGSSRWLQVESFRRFIRDSEARHAEAAARMGLLRHYTAWAVALDELDHWNDVVAAAATSPAVAASANDFRFVSMAPAFSSAAASSFTAPSSSSSGGGGGVGGGGGGGGGGSW